MNMCIDLKKKFGARYRVEYEASYFAERGDRARVHDPWLLIIPCQLGHVCPHGGDILGASTNKRGPAAKRLAALPGVRVVQDGDDGINAVFHVGHFDAVAAILKPRRRRRLSPERAAEQTERLRKYRFSPASQSADAGRRRDPMPSPDSETA